MGRPQNTYSPICTVFRRSTSLASRCLGGFLGKCTTKVVEFASPVYSATTLRSNTFGGVSASAAEFSLARPASSHKRQLSVCGNCARALSSLLIFQPPLPPLWLWGRLASAAQRWREIEPAHKCF